MTETLEIGSAPYEEDCAQLGSSDYTERSKAECMAFKAQLLRQFGEPPEGARLRIKGCSHDFGMYYEVAVSFDFNDERAGLWAFGVENNAPAYWDEQARSELGMTNTKA